MAPTTTTTATRAPKAVAGRPKAERTGSTAATSGHQKSPTTTAAAARKPKAVAEGPKVAPATKPKTKTGTAANPKVPKAAATTASPKPPTSKGLAASPAAGLRKVNAPSKAVPSTKVASKPGTNSTKSVPKPSQPGQMTGQAKKKTSDDYSGLDVAKGPSSKAALPKNEEELVDRMASICQQTLEELQPVLAQITQRLEKAERTPREELDEEELVKDVKPLIEQGSRILGTCKGALSGLDPDGRLAAEARGRAAAREATPKQYRLAELLKELTSSVVTTIDNAKRRISDMPHAKKKLNPLWSLLTEPLFQILAAVGLLVSGVLTLVGNLLKGLGLGSLVKGILGGTGIGKLLGGLGLGTITGALGLGPITEALGLGDQKKGGNKTTTTPLPIVGGVVGGLLGDDGLLGGTLLGDQGLLGGGLLGGDLLGGGLLGARA